MLWGFENIKWGHMYKALHRYLVHIRHHPPPPLLATSWSSSSVWIKWDCSQDCVINLALIDPMPWSILISSVSNLLMMSLWRLLPVRYFVSPTNANPIKTLLVFNLLMILFLFLHFCMCMHMWVQVHPENRRGHQIPSQELETRKSSKCSYKCWGIFSSSPYPAVI